MRVTAVTHLIINLIEVLLFRKVNITNSIILFLIQVNLFVFCHKSSPNQTLWTLPIPEGAKTAAVYGEIQNPIDREITIVSVTSNLYKTVEFHSMNVDNDGIMRMRKRELPIVLLPNETIMLDRNGTHLMLYEKKMQDINLEIQIHFSNGFVQKQSVETKNL